MPGIVDASEDELATVRRQLQQGLIGHGEDAESAAEWTIIKYARNNNVVQWWFRYASGIGGRVIRIAWQRAGAVGEQTVSHAQPEP